MTRHAQTWAMVWGSEPPVLSIGFDEPISSSDSGFTVLFEDAPDPEDVGDPTTHPGISIVCLGCLPDDHSEIGRGLDVACVFGAADLDDDGEWVGRTLDEELDGA